MSRKPLPHRGEPCRHCEKWPINRPGGLCYRCHGQPDIRRQYVGKSKYAQGHHARLDFNGNAPEDAEPLSDGPGTTRRLRELQQRASRGLSLFRAGDPGWEANAGRDVEEEKRREEGRTNASHFGRDAGHNRKRGEQ